MKSKHDIGDRPIKTAKPYDIIAKLRPYWRAAEQMRLSLWTEKHVVLPEEMKARPGGYKNWPYMNEILDCIGDDVHTRVSVMKSVRIGYTTGLVAGIGALAAQAPTQIILLMPTDEDAAEIAVDQVEPIFTKTPELKALMKRDRTGGNNLKNKQFAKGGFLKIRSGRAPRKLRRIDARVLFVDEADAIEVTKEGDAISIAEKRTFSKVNPKIVVGSTPVEEGVSVVEVRYKQGDQRVFESQCPHKECGQWAEIVWEDIKYKLDDAGQNVTDAWWQCPNCHERVDERYKPQMIYGGRWRKTHPEVIGHASFRINAFQSLLAQAKWANLCQMWIEHDRGGPATRQVFVNTILGRPWRVTINRVDAETLMQRVEPWGFTTPQMAYRRKVVIPPEVVAITVGCDTQDDRIEATVVGWSPTMQPHFLGHVVFEGNTLQPEVWQKLDRWHRDAAWTHPNGWSLRIDAMAVDSGGREGRTQVVYDWCGKRLQRGIYAIKGDDGPNKKAWAKAKKVSGNVSLYIIGLDQMKTLVMDTIAKPFADGDGVVVDPTAARFSDSLPEEWFEQATNETRRLRYKQGRPYIAFEPKKQGVRTEAFDCCVYAFAVARSHAFVTVDLAARAARRPVETGEAETPRRARETIAEAAKRLNG